MEKKTRYGNPPDPAQVLNNKIDLAVNAIYEKTMGITQQELARIMKKIILLCVEMIWEKHFTIDEMIEELKNDRA